MIMLGIGIVGAAILLALLIVVPVLIGMGTWLESVLVTLASIVFAFFCYGFVYALTTGIQEVFA